jgi:hypothetical protein
MSHCCYIIGMLATSSMKCPIKLFCAVFYNKCITDNANQEVLSDVLVRLHGPSLFGNFENARHWGIQLKPQQRYQCSFSVSMVLLLGLLIMEGNEHHCMNTCRLFKFLIAFGNIISDIVKVFILGVLLISASKTAKFL